ADKDGMPCVAEYVFYPGTGEFCGINLVPPDAASHEGSSPAFKKTVIDLTLPWRRDRRDKWGLKQLVRCIKLLYFGSETARATRRRCEEFFGNEDNFDVRPGDADGSATQRAYLIERLRRLRASRQIAGHSAGQSLPTHSGRSSTG